MAAWALLSLNHAGVRAADVAISERPLITTQVQARPNLMFTLDNSGSMDWRFMPEEASDRGTYAYLSSQCNGAAYNPSVTYTPPITPEGRAYPNGTFTAAWEDGFIPKYSSSYDNTSSSSVAMDSTLTSISVVITSANGYMNFSSGNTVVLQSQSDTSHWILGTISAITGTSSSSSRTVTITPSFVSANTGGSYSSWRFFRPLTWDLSTNDISDTSDPRYNYFYQYNPTTGSPAALSWTYSNGTPSSSTFNNECLTDTGTSSARFSKVLLSSLTTAQKQNYANWFMYYRKRVLMMRTALGKAMGELNSDYRVGFNTLNDTSGSGNSTNTSVTPLLTRFANVSEFDATQRRLIYSNLYGARASGGTPLRLALAKIGRYFANDISGQTDPIRFSCQRNFSILSTDGYWNDSSNPKKLGGSSDIGNQDNTESRPMYDGSSDSVTTETRHVYTQTGTCTRLFIFPGVTYRDDTQQRTITTTTSGTSTGNWTTTSSSNSGCVESVPASPSATTSNTVSGGDSNTLADVAAYYYKTDLRTTNCSRTEGSNTIDLCSNNVPKSEISQRNPPTDLATHQHMTTYTLGLGLSGTLTYDGDYLNQETGDYKSVVDGTKIWPKPATGDSPTKIDDLWHAAVNGRGRYFSARSTTELINALTSTFEDINAKDGAGSAAASSSLQPELGRDQVYVGTYKTKTWEGDIKAFTLVKENNVVRVRDDVLDWSAQAGLNSRTYTTRAIYYMRKQTSAGVTTASLGDFTYANLSTDTDATTLTGYFSNICDKTPRPTQCSSLTTAEITSMSGANLVNFLRGDRTNEGAGKIYRQRAAVLGDIVDAAPVYLGKPPFNYGDQGYASYLSANANRCPLVFAAANDGMLHAFSAKTASSSSTCPTAGSEVWAYVPRAVMSKMYRLADTDYDNNHVFFVNGSPIIGDVSQTTTASGTTTVTWKTMLVGGFGAGGRGYYALDISNPSSPSILWEFVDDDIGLTFSPAVITKIPGSDGNPVWVVAFTSGLNNNTAGSLTRTGIGNGYLYILNAHTGALLYKVPTNDTSGNPVGSLSTPSGLGKLNAWINSETDNTTQRFYAGDQLGNLWRINVANLTPPASGADTRATRLAQFKIGSTPQPLTIRPELAEITYGGTRHAIVLVGTGRYLGSTDLSDTSQQSIYAIRDPLTTTGWGDVRNNTGLVSQTLTTVGDVRTISHLDVDWNDAATVGWKIDFAEGGERVISNMSLQYNTLSLTSAIPKNTSCNGSGTSWLYNFNIYNGSYTDDNAASAEGGTKLGDYLALGLSAVAPQGETKTGLLITHSDGGVEYRIGQGQPQGGVMRRTSWRELLD